MSEFVAEQYLSAADAAAARRSATAARLAAEQLRREGTRVRFVRSIFIPSDETCIYIFEADSDDAVRLVAKRAALRLDRISEALTEPGSAASAEGYGGSGGAERRAATALETLGTLTLPTSNRRTT